MKEANMKISVIYHSETGNVQKMAELVAEGARQVEGADVRLMPVDSPDKDYLEESDAVIFGSPTYEGCCSWQMKKFLDSCPAKLGGKLAGVFISQNWPGGGGGSFAEMTILAAALVHGMLIYSGGVDRGEPFLHFGAVSQRSPVGNNLYEERCKKLGDNIATKAQELFHSG